MFRFVLRGLLCAALLSSTALAAELQTETAAAPDPAPPAPASGMLTLSAVIDRVLAHAPRLQSATSAELASKGERRQAGLWTNPELSVEAENFGGDNSYKGFDVAEVTYGVSQLIEIGGKRSARMDIADRAASIAAIDLSATRLDLIRDTTTAYAEAVAAQERVTLAREQKALAEEVREAVTRRVQAAADPLFQQSKADVAYATSVIALDKAERDLLLARQKLAALWGGESAGFELDRGSFLAIAEPGTLASLEAGLERNPDTRRGDIEFEKGRASLALEEANAIPDPQLTAGVRDFRETGDKAFVVGLAMPLPVVNRNQGNIEKAGHELNKRDADRRAARSAIMTELRRHWHDLQNAFKQANSLKSQILPSAERAFSLTRQAHRSGKLGYLEVLDAQRTLFDAKEQHIASLQAYHTAKAEVERLSAAHLGPQPTSEAEDEK